MHVQSQQASAETRGALGTASIPRIFLAEDSPALRALICGVLRREGYKVLELEDGEALYRALHVARLRDELPALVISDGVMPRRSGLEVLRRIRASGIGTPYLLITAFGDVSLHREVAGLRSACVVDKPVDIEGLRMAARLFISPPAKGGAGHEQ